MSKWLERFKKSRNLIFTKDDFKKYSLNVKEEFNFFKKYLKRGSKVLECGCGLGCTAVPLSHYYDITCIDIDKEVLKYAKINGKNFGKNMKFKLIDVFDVDKKFKEDSFDACTHGGFIEHFPEKKIKRLLKKQLKIAPLIIFSMPIRTKYNLKAYKTRKTRTGEVHIDQIYRNLWTKKYWLNTILKDFNVVEFKEAGNKYSISGLDELMVVIKRQD